MHIAAAQDDVEIVKYLLDISDGSKGLEGLLRIGEISSTKFHFYGLPGGATNECDEKRRFGSGALLLIRSDQPQYADGDGDGDGDG